MVSLTLREIPKSATFSADGRKFYIHSLEGCATTVYDARTYEKLATIKHCRDDVYVMILGRADILAMQDRLQ